MESENDFAPFIVDVTSDGKEIAHFESDVVSGITLSEEKSTGFSFGVADLEDVAISTIGYLQSNMKLLEGQAELTREEAIATILHCAILAANTLDKTSFDVKQNVITDKGIETPEHLSIRNLAEELGIEMSDE